MSATLNAQLIDAVEDGREADVERLLEAGASPDARKTVTLKAKVEMPKGLFGGGGGLEWKDDSADCESALVLAILHARVGVVRVLLENGASVDRVVERKIGYTSYFGEQKWKADEWKRMRWHWTTTFPSILAAALGCGGQAKNDYYGSKSDTPDVNGQLNISPRGGTVILNHPTKWDHACVAITLQPNVRIVRLLLAHGARVTDVELEGARTNPNQEFLNVLLSHQRNIITRQSPGTT
ncbi:hypothetical protein M427DRAFT_324109 [Gonapodya prolifera JEL478]|uniref:Ankyrin n=1 Tax=Gonapodya prolifera (strain JEL478) TaxID=1344416 RepID=A0A139AF36_GONPJ|nr:hypothetical protein M427DRAFT_324109 [Gonapodya prolifera JEL478]|eukprot:KXS15368.1 hypothetical protein M427DRAFT_324109 [Gonapodya prolifera JEL478]